MWPTGNNRWIYQLNSPLDSLPSIGYRYCRSGQCGSADDVLTAGINPTGRLVNTSLLTQNIVDTMSGWQWLGAKYGPTTILATDIPARESGFIAGIEFQPIYHPNWQILYEKIMAQVTYLNPNYVILTPTWSFTRTNPPVFETVPGHDPLWFDLTAITSHAQSKQLNVALFPTPSFSTTAEEWWQEADLDANWWNAWFERYRAFALHHAEFAARYNIPLLILGGDWLIPALPNGTLTNGSSSGVPAETNQYWQQVLADVRTLYRGKIGWAISHYQGGHPPPEFLDQVDVIYVLWSAPLTSNPNAPIQELVAEAGRVLDSQIQLLYLQFQKPILFAVSFPSANGAVTGCLSLPQGGCLDFNQLSRPNADVSFIQIDLQEQADAYNAILTAINSRSWISGIISRGYYPPTSLQDKSSSVHGKPAADVLWYWFPRLLGNLP
jgi:hypothetical protein